MEAALCGDHVRKFVGQIDVRKFEGAAFDEAQAVRARAVVGDGQSGAADRARRGETGEKIVAFFDQRRRVGEVLEREFVRRDGAAVGVEFHQVAQAVETERLELRSGRRGRELYIAQRSRGRRRRSTGEALHAITLRGDDVALAIRTEIAGARDVLIAVDRILHAKETVAGNADVGVQARAGQSALRELRLDVGNLHAGADLLRGQIGSSAVSGGRAAERVAEAVGETHARSFEPRGIHVGDIVADGFEAAGESAQGADAGSKGTDE